MENEIAEINVVNLRNFTKGKYRQVDDEPYGGGDGMVMMAEPFFKAIDHTISLWNEIDDLRIVYPTPQGELWSQKTAREFSMEGNIIFLCGHYKGIDERVIEKYVTHEFSLGDYVISGGELSSMVSTSGLQPGMSHTAGCQNCVYLTVQSLTPSLSPINRTRM